MPKAKKAIKRPRPAYKEMVRVMKHEHEREIEKNKELSQSKIQNLRDMLSQSRNLRSEIQETVRNQAKLIDKLRAELKEHENTLTYKDKLENTEKALAKQVELTGSLTTRLNVVTQQKENLLNVIILERSAK